MFYGSLDTCQPLGAFTRVRAEAEKKKKKGHITNKCISSMLLGKLFSCDFKFRKIQKKYTQSIYLYKTYFRSLCRRSLWILRIRKYLHAFCSLLVGLLTGMCVRNVNATRRHCPVSLCPWGLVLLLSFRT